MYAWYLIMLSTKKYLLYLNGDFDLEIEIPSHAFERLDIKQGQIIRVSLKKNAIHIIKE
jgi:hypothetical protein